MARPGLTGNVTTITFSEGNLATGTPLGTNFAGTGVSFTGLGADNNYGSFPNTSGEGASNFSVSNFGPFSIIFSSAVSNAVFTLITNNSTTPSVIQSYLGNTLVETADAFTSTSNTNDIYGFTDSRFDRIVVTPETAVNQAAVIDNLQFTADVPEPTSWALMITGFGLVGVAARRRSARSMAVTA